MRLPAFLCALALTACQRSTPAPTPPPAPADARRVVSSRDATAADAVATDASAAPAPSAARPPADLNVILLSIDSLRADMPWAGYPRPIAPRLTALEATAVSYTRAYALSSYTSMSVGGFLGGRLPGELARDGYFFGTYPSRVLFFPERLQAAGIRTIAAHAHGYFRPHRAGFDQGFDVWEMIPNLRWDPTTDVEITGERHVALAQRLLSDPQNTSGRFFAWFHLMDPHDQYQSHPGVPPWGRSLRDRYDGEVTYTDRLVGGFIDWVRAQPWGARTAIIITADHGEGFGEHGEYRHAFHLWQELVRVPWMFLVPGATPRRIGVNRGHADLAPTVLDLFGLPPEPEFHGTSLVPELFGAEAVARDVWVDLARTSNFDRRRAMIHDHYKVVAYGDDARFDVFDLDADPGERTTLSRTDRPLFVELVGRYRAAQPGFRVENPYACRTLTGAPPGRRW